MLVLYYRRKALPVKTGEITISSQKQPGTRRIPEPKTQQALEAQRNNARAESLANRTHNTEFLGVVKADSAWIAWLEGNLVQAQADGRAALELWQQTPFIYTLQWTALWPLIGVALAQNQLSEAVDSTRALLAPSQQRLPDDLTSILEAAIQAWDNGQPDIVRSHLQQATTLAQEMGYL